MDGWVSEDYGRLQPAPLLLYRTHAVLPVRLATILIPVENPMAGPPSVATVIDEHEWPVGLAFGDGERVLFQGSVLPRPGCGDRPAAIERKKDASEKVEPAFLK
jgi:hypothetical protein